MFYQDEPSKGVDVVIDPESINARVTQMRSNPTAITADTISPSAAKQHKALLDRLERENERVISLKENLKQLAEWLGKNDVPPLRRKVKLDSGETGRQLWIIRYDASKVPTPSDVYLVAYDGALHECQHLSVVPGASDFISECDHTHLKTLRSLESWIEEAIISYCITYKLKWGEITPRDAS